MVDVLDGETVELRVAGADTTVWAHLAGVREPAEDSCARDGLMATLMDLVTDAPMFLTTLWIERDPTLEGGEPAEVYLWIEGDAGMRILLNLELVATGFAERDDLDPDARFATWIGEAGRTAEEAVTCGAEPANVRIDTA